MVGEPLGGAIAGPSHTLLKKTTASIVSFRDAIGSKG